ncbi:chemotaxis protein CheB [Hydrocarboniclastica marina]|uniref:protein-glutamate methylesterase n=1 Tax=Hydrocarboniclastica marina TaxID=2259620 RepID=A0A4P7XD26_9ALTE|nr:chemotaxis protein CheB [Hydrocarboniclastica marina]
MPADPVPSVAIVSDNPLQRLRLQQAVAKLGLAVGFVGDPSRYWHNRDAVVADLWVVELDDENAQPQLLDELLDDDTRRLLFGLGMAPPTGHEDYPRWERRLFGKLQEQLGRLELLDNVSELEALDRPEGPDPLALPGWVTPASRGVPADQVWILGASLGGPAAVKAFLDKLPGGLPLAFVYAQHIDQNFIPVLARVLGRHAQYPLVEAVAGEPLRCGEVLMVPVERELYLDREGLIRFRDDAWPGPYGPSIDQVMLNLAECFQADCHAILFSGMGNDGAVAAPLLKAYGSRIWIQEASSCASSAMPDSVASTGCTEFVGTPDELAQQLVRCIEDSELLERKHLRDQLTPDQP